VLIDCSKLGYVSSAGLRVLLAAQKIMNKQGSMCIKNVSAAVKDIFEVTGFSDILTII
jgi:anti-sigma B factor antagonist